MFRPTSFLFVLISLNFLNVRTSKMKYVEKQSVFFLNYLEACGVSKIENKKVSGVLDTSNNPKTMNMKGFWSFPIPPRDHFWNIRLKCFKNDRVTQLVRYSEWWCQLLPHHPIRKRHHHGSANCRKKTRGPGRLRKVSSPILIFRLD